MRVLVTGHRGYIGAVLIPMLLETEHEVVGLDTDLFAGCDFGPPLDFQAEGRGRVREVEKDLRDVERADFDDLEGIDAVIHLAGLSNDPLGDIDPDLTVEINERASIRFARLAKEAGVERFVFASSCSTYGAAGDALLDETAAFNPVTPYGRSKVRMEEALGAMADDGFSPTYLRNATACGVSPRLRLDLVLNNLVGWAHTTGKVRLLSDGSPWRPLVHIEDISQAFLAVLAAPRETIHDQAFNVGRTDENFRIRELAEIVAETVPGCEVEIAEGAGPDKRTYRVDFGKIERGLPGFAARWTVRRTARELYEAYCRIGLSREDFDGPSYKRLATIQRLLAADRLSRDLRWQAAATAG